MKHRTIIGLCGDAGAGKSAVAQILCELHGFTELSFAQRLKEVAVDLGWNGVKDERGRRFLQTLGTDAVRAYDPDYWVVEVLRQLTAVRGPVVVSDCRFTNELQMVVNLGGVVWSISRYGTKPANSHRAEHEWKTFDGATMLSNHGTLDDLARTVTEALSKITAT